MIISPSTKLWAPSAGSRPGAARRLFCFPYAGTGASVFAGWQRLVPASVEVVGLHLPGHEERLREPAFRRLDPLLDALEEALRPLLDLPFAFYGHSMGGWVAFYLARRFRDAGLKQPAHLFVGASRAPQQPSRHPIIHALSRQQFVDHVRDRYGQIPAAILNDPEMMDIVIGMLQADFAVFETAGYRTGAPLDLPISAYAGDADTAVNSCEMEGWGAQTRSGFTLEVLPGDHFFLKGSIGALLARMTPALRSI